ncbi:MAG: SGNH hydrolase domain-containing protein [bacterium]
MISLTQAYPELASYLPLSQYVCDTTTCHALIGEVVVYFDSHHLTSAFSRSMAPYFRADVDAALRAGR